jgi:hypothetical protein
MDERYTKIESNVNNAGEEKSQYVTYKDVYLTADTI